MRSQQLVGVLGRGINRRSHLVFWGGLSRLLLTPAVHPVPECYLTRPEVRASGLRLTVAYGPSTHVISR